LQSGRHQDLLTLYGAGVLSCELQHHKQDSDTMFEDTSQYSCDKLQQQEKIISYQASETNIVKKKMAQGRGRIEEPSAKSTTQETATEGQYCSTRS